MPGLLNPIAIDSLTPEDLAMLGLGPSAAAASPEAAAEAGPSLGDAQKFFPGAGALAATIGGALIGGLLNKPSSSERAATDAAGRAAQSQADEIDARNRLRGDLEGMIRDRASGGRPPFIPFNLDNPADMEGAFAQMAPMADINHLMRLLGIPGSGTGGIGAASALAGSAANRRSANAAGVGALATELLMNLFNRGGVQRYPQGVPSGTSFGNGTVIGNG